MFSATQLKVPDPAAALGYGTGQINPTAAVDLVSSTSSKLIISASCATKATVGQYYNLSLMRSSKIAPPSVNLEAMMF